MTRLLGRLGVLGGAVLSVLAAVSCGSGENDELASDRFGSEELDLDHGDQPDGQGHEHDHNHDAGQGQGHGHGHNHGDRASCEVTVVDRVLRQELEVSEPLGGGDVIELVSVRELDMTVPKGDVFTETVTIGMRGGPILYSSTTRAAAGEATQGNVSWGSLVQGARNAEFSVTGNVLSGSIDGRGFVLSPADADPADALFADGGESPDLRANRSLQHALSDLTQRAASTLEHCAPDDDDTAGRLLAAPLNREQDPGHFSDTYSTFSCDGCKASVVAGATIGCTLACIFSFGTACASCIAAATVAVPAGILACSESGACCPEACGDGLAATCCFGDEACLNGATGLCCSANQQPCVGMTCCNSDQSCMDGGPKKGTCCPDGSLCGQNCCPDDETCSNAGSGLCCQPERACGNVCCGRSDTDPLSYCLDPVHSECCTTLQEACDGKCCGFNQVCDSGVCIPAPPQPPSDAEECQSHQFGPPCSVFEDCPQGGPYSVCRSGCCQGVR